MSDIPRLGFIGYGNMAQAIVAGLLRAGACPPSRICACAKDFDKLSKNAHRDKIMAFERPEDVVAHSDWIILAVKPHQIKTVLSPIAHLLTDKPILSIAAGYSFDHYQTLLGTGARHISTIPNTPIAICEGILVCEERHSLTPEEYRSFLELFSKVALIEVVDSAHLSIAGTLSGCTPAFTAIYLEALADAGVKHGLSRSSAYRMAAKMLCGTGALYLENREHPAVMKDTVCSPGGTTICGIASLEKNAFRGTVIEAVDAIENRSLIEK